MKKLSIAIFLGIIVGIIDVIPMIIQGLNWYANASAFCFWIVVSIIIAYTTINISHRLKGMIVALISAIPIMILAAEKDPKGVFVMLIMAIILGILLGGLNGSYSK